jgi:hypothetical protein
LPLVRRLLSDAAGEYVARTAALGPWREACFGPCAGSLLDFGDDLVGLDEDWYASFDH